MNLADNTAMRDALRLTQSGDLTGATEMLQRMLTGTAPAPQPQSDAPVIDLVAERVTQRPRPTTTTTTGGGFHQRSYSGAEGRLDYRLYVPADARPGLPLVVMLHGCTQSPEDFARGTAMNKLADELGFVVAYPGQTAAANAQKCWNWFRPQDQRRGSGEPALIAAVTRAAIAEQRCDAGRVYVAGLSAGGAAAAIMGVAYPDIFAAIGVHSGLACGSASDMPSAFAAMRGGGAGRAAPANDAFVPVITFHGDRDGTVAESNAERIATAAIDAAGTLAITRTTGTTGGRRHSMVIARDDGDRSMVERWTVHGAAHAWSGGDSGGSYADARGPDASREMMRFFLQHELAGSNR